MFNKREKNKDTEIPSNTPLSGVPDPQAVRAYFSKHTLAIVERNRAYSVAVGSVIVALIAVSSIFLLLPLKQRIPYLVEVNSNGIPVAKPIAITENQTISHTSIFYFSSIWVRNLLTINPGLSHSYLLSDYNLSSGSGRQAFISFLNSNVDHNPLKYLKKYPSLRGTVKINSINFIGNNYNNILINATRFVNKHGHPFYSQKFSITLTYIVSYPKTLKSAYQNPIGFDVTNLSISIGDKVYA